MIAEFGLPLGPLAAEAVVRVFVKRPLQARGASFARSFADLHRAGGRVRTGGDGVAVVHNLHGASGGCCRLPRQRLLQQRRKLHKRRLLRRTLPPKPLKSEEKASATAAERAKVVTEQANAAAESAKAAAETKAAAEAKAAESKNIL